MNQAFEAEYPDFEGADWYYPWQGGGTIAAERSAETLKLFDEYYELILDPARLDETVQRIEQATGITIQNHQDLPAINPSMFVDTTHLNRYQGAAAYTRYLVEQYSGYLNE